MDEWVLSMVLTSTEESIAVGLSNSTTRVIEVESLKMIRDFDGDTPTFSGDNKMLFTRSNEAKDISVFDVPHSSFLRHMKPSVIH